MKRKPKPKPAIKIPIAVKILKLKPDDVVVFKCDDVITEAVATQVKQRAEQLLPNVRVMVLGKGMDITKVIRQ